MTQHQNVVGLDIGHSTVKVAFTTTGSRSSCPPLIFHHLNPIFPLTGGCDTFNNSPHSSNNTSTRSITSTNLLTLAQIS